MPKINEQKIGDILSRGVQEIIVKEALQKKLESRKVLRVKFGIDPTAPDLHLGHAVVLRKLKRFQDLGHKIILVIGDFTATIGDPTGKSSIRTELTEKQANLNMKTYIKQAGKILDIRKIEVRHNTEWFKNMKMREFYSLARLESVFDLMQRSMFRERVDKKEMLALSEFTYPLLQAYDSFHIKADIELGGVDQLFNMKHGRELQEKLSQNPQDIMGLKLLVGIDGAKKMSKSLNNHISLNDAPNNMFGKVMSISDNLISDYVELCTELSLEEVKSIPNPRDQKSLLAREIVKMYHGEKEAQKAEEEFNKTFKDGGLPSEIEIFETDKTTYPILDLLFDSKLAESKSDAKRVVEGGGVEVKLKVKSYKVKSWKEELQIEDGMIIKFGKRRFVKIKIEK